ncbi:21754_t:CDS:2 [Dentiscutata erythropus]|uniref:21754_t:CDS:1 n=1 Tax=Dentiscutata erythropus TaxID=1348616 RepID=A0A9N9BE76_9GLOM|nr:21754_t:CDS:2 [Dentiscutata erythropus]
MRQTSIGRLGTNRRKTNRPSTTNVSKQLVKNSGLDTVYKWKAKEWIENEHVPVGQTE